MNKEVKLFGRGINKKGLSPIIATILLIAIAIVLGLIIYVWARSFVGERLEKFGSPVDYACKDVRFDAEVTDDKLHVVNQGNVALYGVEIRDKSAGTIESVGTFERTIVSGEDSEIDLQGVANSEEAIFVIPIILGETEDATKAHVCGEEYGVEISIA